MKVCNAIVVGSGDKRGQRDYVLRVIILDSMQVAKLTVVGCFVSNDVTCLDVSSLPTWLRAYEIYLTCLQLSYIDFVAKADEMIVDDILYHLFDVTLASTPSKGVANTIVFEVIFVIALKQALAVNVVAVHLVEHVGIAQELGVIGYSRCSDFLALRLHVFCYTIGRDNLPRIVGKESHKILKERYITNLISHDDILEKHRVDYIRLVFSCVLLVQAITY